MRVYAIWTVKLTFDARDQWDGGGLTDPRVIHLWDQQDLVGDCSWLMTNPERSSGDIFRELQRLSPGRYQPLQIRTLQRGMRKIRAYPLETREDQWQVEVIRGPSPPPVSSAENPVRIL